MNKELIVTGASQLLTLAGPARPRIGSEMAELGIINDGAVMIKDGVIAAVGSRQEVEAIAARSAIRIDANGCVVAPGFVDAHTHPVFAGTREDEYEMRATGATYQQIAVGGGGILSTVRKTRLASEDELFRISKPRAQTFLDYGTTTIEAKSGYGLTLEDELKLLRVIRRLNEHTPLELVPTFLGAHEIPSEFRNAEGAGLCRKDYLRLVLDQMLPAVAKEGLARYADVFCESHVFTIDESRQVLSRAKELGLGVRLHAEQLTLCGGAALAAEMSAASADHLEHLDDAGIQALRRSGTIGVLLPGAVFNLGLTRYAPARKMIEAGVPVAIATDFNPGSSPSPSMQIMHSIACTHMAMTPAECFTASTVNAAYSLGLGDRIGSLEVGKQADLVVFDVPDYRQVPYFYGVNHARIVIKRGEKAGMVGSDF